MNIINEEKLKLENNYILLKSNLQEFLHYNFCFTCGRLKGDNSKIGFMDKDSGSLLCIKCSEKCLLCNNPVSITKETKNCVSCKRTLCSTCIKEKAPIQKIFPKCSQCLKKENCIKCINFNGVTSCCKNCIIENNFKTNPELVYMGIIRENKNKWEFSKNDFQEADIQNILFYLENSFTISTISFTKLSSFKTKEQFKDFLNSIRNHKALKNFTIEISNPINPRIILKLVENKLNEIVFLETFSIIVNSFKDSQNLEIFRDSCEYLLSPINNYFKVEYKFQLEESSKWLGFKSSNMFSYYFSFVKKTNKNFGNI